MNLVQILLCVRVLVLISRVELKNDGSSAPAGELWLLRQNLRISHIMVLKPTTGPSSSHTQDERVDSKARDKGLKVEMRVF